MRRTISIFSILGVVAAAIMFIVLATSTIKAPEGFPLNEARFIEFEVDEETFDRLTPREQRDQMLDWLLYTVVSDVGLSIETINQSLFDIPAIRYGYMHPIANFEYGETRSVYIGDGKVVALVPADSSAIQRHDYLAYIADKHRKNLGEIPPKLLVFDYQLDLDAQFALLTRRQEFDTQKLYTEGAGYYEAEIRNLSDLERFMNQIDDITFAQVNGNRLRLGGRKIRSREYRGIRVEDVAVIWQAEKKIYEELAQFEARWQKKLDELNARWKGKRFRPEEIPEKERQYKEEFEQLQRAMIQERIDLGLVEGSGFSLDPTYDYDGLMSFFEGIEPQLRLLASEDGSPITIQDIEEAKNALTKHAEIRFPEVPFLRLVDKLSKSEDFREFGKKISSKIKKYRFQAARYDGNLQGTEVGMVLFYTDLLAKLWRFDYAGSAPSLQIEDFKTHLNVSVSPIYQREIEDMPATRLWFGPKNMGFQLAGDGNSLLFARNATRIYAASHNPLNPGVEETANALSSASLEWWNNHYEEVARYEQEYQRFNEIMKWSLVISWLNEANKGKFLNFLQGYPVTRSNWFPEWVRRHPELKFQKWDEVGFHPRGYKGTRTEAMPILSTREFRLFGERYHVTGGVSLAPKSLFEERKPLSEAINRLLRRSNLDYGSRGLRTYGGIAYTLRNLARNRVSVTSRVKEGTKLRGRHAELATREFERILTQKPLGLSVETRAGGNRIGNLEISRTKKGFKVSWRSREIDAGQSLARRLSKSENPDRVLLEDPTVEAMFKLPGEHHYLVKMWGMDRWMKTALEKEPSAEIASGWQSRVADPESASQNLLLTWMDEGAVRSELSKQRYIVIESVERTDKIIWKAAPLRVPPEGSKELFLEIKSGAITIKGQLDENGAIYLGSNEFFKTLPNEDYWIGLQKLIGVSDLEQIRKMAPGTPTIRYTIPETRFIDNPRFIRKLKTALEHHDYPKVAQDIANAPHEFRMRLAQHLAEELKRSDRFLTNGHFVKAIQHLNDLIAIHGLRPELTLRKRIAEQDVILEDVKALRKLDALLQGPPGALFLPAKRTDDPRPRLILAVKDRQGMVRLHEFPPEIREKLKQVTVGDILKFELLPSEDVTELRENLLKPLLDDLGFSYALENRSSEGETWKVYEIQAPEGPAVAFDVPEIPELRALIYKFISSTSEIAYISTYSNVQNIDQLLSMEVDGPITVIMGLPSRFHNDEEKGKEWGDISAKLQLQAESVPTKQLIDATPWDEANKRVKLEFKSKEQLIQEIRKALESKRHLLIFGHFVGEGTIEIGGHKFAANKLQKLFKEYRKLRKGRITALLSCFGYIYGISDHSVVQPGTVGFAPFVAFKPEHVEKFLSGMLQMYSEGKKVKVKDWVKQMTKASLTRGALFELLLLPLCIDLDEDEREQLPCISSEEEEQQ